jgi:hypothetical protein
VVRVGGSFFREKCPAAQCPSAFLAEIPEGPKNLSAPISRSDIIRSLIAVNPKSKKAFFQFEFRFCSGPLPWQNE